MTISIVTLAEIREGIDTAPVSDRRALTQWFETEVQTRFLPRALPLSTEILIDWIKLSRKLAAERMMRKAADLLLASTARVHNLTLVTRKLRDFANTGVVVYDPWNDKTHVMDAPDAR